MPRRSRIFNPVNFISWRDNFELLTVNNLTLIAMVRLLIDQATGTGGVPLNDYPVSGDIFWPSQQLYDATNEVMIDYWGALGNQSMPIALTSAAFVVTTGADIFPFPYTTIMQPSYIVLNTSSGTGASLQTINQKYWISDVTKFEQFNNNWRMYPASQPRWFSVFDAFNIRIFPQASQTYTFEIYGVPWPVELATGTEDITCDAILKLAIAYKAAANILEATRPDTADSYMKEAEELLLRYRIRLRDQSSNNIRRLKPGVGTTGSDTVIAANKGVIRIGKKLS
jgi:hypothetical protein